MTTIKNLSTEKINLIKEKVAAMKYEPRTSLIDQYAKRVKEIYFPYNVELELIAITEMNMIWGALEAMIPPEQKLMRDFFNALTKAKDETHEKN